MAENVKPDSGIDLGITPSTDNERTDPGITLSTTPRPNSRTAPPAPKPSPAATQAAPPRPLIKMPSLGPLDPLMKDSTISEIMVNDLRNVMIERSGKMVFSGFRFQALEELNMLVTNILDTTGRILSPDQAYVDVMLPDGSRVNIVGPPLTVYGPCITIRKFPARTLSVDDLMSNEMLDRRIAYFLNACVLGRINILVAGGTGSGKTTLLNALASFVPKTERVVTIEDTPELRIKHQNSVRMQTKAQTPTSQAVTARELVANALRMRPDRIIVGECRRSEAMDMLQAMNTGHDGSMTTLHANSPRDALARLETLCLMAGLEIPLLAIRKQITSAIDLLIQVKRFRDGQRRIVAVTEVTGMEAETYTLQDIYVFDPEARLSQAGEPGIFKGTGLVPTFLDKLKDQGVELPRNYFA